MDSSEKTTGCIYYFSILYLVAVCIGTIFLIIHKEGNFSLYIYAIITIISISYFLITIHFNNKKNEEEVRKLHKLVREYKIKEKNLERDYTEKNNELIKLEKKYIREYEIQKKSLERDYTMKKNELIKLEKKYVREHEIQEKNLKHDFAEKEKELIALEEKYNKTLQNSNPFRFVAEMFSDWETIVYDNTCYFLRTKKHPAIKKSLEVKELKEKTRNIICNFKEMNYKYQFLLEAFPELKQYVDDAESLKYLADYTDYSDFKEEHDEVLDWISSEEYKMMSEDDRNQLALDRYKKAHKSEWQIGMQYEMYIGYHLRNEGFHVVQYGIEHGLEDLGRDIIATRMEDGMEVTYIIQCKNWAKDKLIHENVVCQLYGTTMQYEFTHKGLFTIVKPLLYVTNELSDVAKKFANKLNVLYEIKKLDDFPMIKCNINNGNKIYHLPFDQQYYRTKIELHGEFYAWTVEEAVNAGFRRARRYMFNESI